MNGYEGRHRKHATPAELAEVSDALPGLADLITIVDSKREDI